jgi:signal transduction histidine kinase
MRSQRLANVGFLAAGVAHEINNPLTAISMAADSLELRLSDHIDFDSDDGRDLLERVAMIRRESRRCGDITARLLDFSRGDRGQPVVTNLTELVHEVMAMVRHLGRFSDRSLQFDCSGDVTAEVIPSQIKQVILNLVSNALQATDPGGHVTIKLVQQTDSVVLDVTDDGCGMDQETLQHVFDPFFTSQPQGQGTGLGLSITHRIVEDHGGTVTPGSPGTGKGSIFSVRLPRRPRFLRAA